MKIYFPLNVLAKFELLFQHKRQEAGEAVLQALDDFLQASYLSRSSSPFEL